MQVTRTMMVLFLFLGGCGGYERAEGPPTADGGAAAKATAGSFRAPGIAAGRIQAGPVQATAAGRTLPTAPPQAPGAGAPPPPPGVQQPPPGGAPEEGADEGDCIVVADATPDYGPPPLAVAFSAEAECNAGQP